MQQDGLDDLRCVERREDAQTVMAPGCHETRQWINFSDFFDQLLPRSRSNFLFVYKN